MSELAKLTAAPRTDALPGHVLSRFGLADYGQMETEFARLHIAEACDAARDQPQIIRDRILELAMIDVRVGWFNWGRVGFDARCMAASSVPFMLWVNLRITEPAITRDEATALMTRDNEDVIQQALLEMAGFSFSKNDDRGANPHRTQTANPSPGATSSNSSEPNATSTISKSAA